MVKINPVSVNCPLFKLLKACHSLTLYRGLLETTAGKSFYRLIHQLSEKDSDHLQVIDHYHVFLSLLLEDVEKSALPMVGDSWQNFILNFIINDSNPFSRSAQKRPLSDMNPALLKAAKHDLLMLQHLYESSTLIAKNFSPLQDEEYPTWQLAATDHDTLPFHRSIKQIKTSLHHASHWGHCIEDVASFFHNNSYGIFARHIGFKWSDNIKGVLHIDPIKMENLVGYDIERETVIQNTRQFLLGCPANNILLYGDRGTGKSSTVKALLNDFWQQGLRIVEMNKNHLSQLPELLEILRELPHRYIVFVDDLSFESTEREYLTLKAILEGNLETRPQNVLIYATSNRRHLIKEVSSDRNLSIIKKENEEFRAQDTLQEKLSLADRFGITVIFPSPDQQTYLAIVENLAYQRGLDIEPELLRQKALQWAMLHNGRSGRTARQFVDQLEGQQAR